MKSIEINKTASGRFFLLLWLHISYPLMVLYYASHALNNRESFSREPGQTVNFRRICRATGSRLKGNTT